MGRISLLFCVLFCVSPAFCVEHSLFYIYTALSKPVDRPGIHDFTAMGMLNDRLIDYYSSETPVKVPKQQWMKEKNEDDYWVKGTQSRRSKEQWFKVNVDILIQRMRHNKSDLHVLQWRHGCVIDETLDGNEIKRTFVNGVDEYSYDGTEFLSFDEANSRWIAPVSAAEPTKRKWDGVDVLNQYTKGYLEKECVEWLTKFLEYGQEQLREQSPPEVHLFSKTSVRDPNKLTLTCLATGFLPPDATMHLRKSRTALPDHLVISSGIVPNGDDSYQLKGHTTIEKDPTVTYDCCVTHSALKRPIIVDWVFEEPGVPVEIIAAVVGALLLIALIVILVLILKKRGIIGSKLTDSGKLVGSSSGSSGQASGQESRQASNEDIKLMDNASSADSGHCSSNQGSREEIPENLQPMLPANGEVVQPV